mgnify:CR=1 FL=1
MRLFHESLHEESSLFVNHLLCLRCIPAAGVPARLASYSELNGRLFCLQKT